QYLQPGRRDSLFTFSLDFDPSLFDQPIYIQWRSMLATIPVGSGQFFVRPEVFQSLTHFDAVKASSTTLPSSDPLFDFKVTDSNSTHSQIDGMSFEVLNTGAGSFRPSAAFPPAGWLLDSVSSTIVSFHAIAGNGLNYPNSLDGFKAAIR